MSPYQIFNQWLFDGSRTSPIPKEKDGVDILKYNSPISNTFVLQLFMRNGEFNYYLNKHFNNIGLRYLDKEELFLFMKKCVIDFRASKNQTVFYPYKYKDKLFEVLRDRIPELKNHDIQLLCEIIEKSPEKDSIYTTLGLDKPPKKKKIKLKKKKVEPNKKVTLKGFLDKHFSVMDE